MYEALVSLCDSQTSLFGDVMQASTYLNFYLLFIIIYRSYYTFWYYLWVTLYCSASFEFF